MSDASPIISLSAVGRLNLLRHLYERVLIPEAVHQEIVRAGEASPGVGELRAAEWIVAEPIEDRRLVQALEGQLDLGEAEAIALAVERKAGLLLMDERRGRTVATRLGARVVGVLGVLVEVKQKGLVAAVEPVLEALLTEAGFRVTSQLYERVLRTVGEWQTDD